MDDEARRDIARAADTLHLETARDDLDRCETRMADGFSLLVKAGLLPDPDRDAP